MASAPWLFIADCSNTFDMENTIPCSPAGMPIISILLSSVQCNLASLMCILYGSFSFCSRSMISRALIAFAMPVAMATPSTPIFKTITKKRFSMALATPATTRMYKGRLVSPMLRRIAAPKLKIRKKGMLRK